MLFLYPFTGNSLSIVAIPFNLDVSLDLIGCVGKRGSSCIQLLGVTVKGDINKLLNG